MVLLKDVLKDFLTEMLAGDIVFGKGVPNKCAFIGASDVIIGLSLDFGDDSGVDGVQRVETFGVELNGGHGVTAVRFYIRHREDLL